MPQSIKLEKRLISELIREDDHRQDYGDMKALCESIKLKGVLQPITVRDDGKILAGRRRHKACEMLSIEEIPCLVRPTESRLDEIEIELIENSFRKDMTWQEQAAIHKTLHDMYKEEYGDDWSGRKTALLLSKSVGKISEDLKLADLIPNSKKLQSINKRSDALKLVKKIETTIDKRDKVKEFKKSAPTSKNNILKVADSNYNVMDAFDYIEYLKDVYEDTQSMISLIEVDPPYGIDLHDNKRSDVSSEYKEIDATEYSQWLSKLCQGLYDVAAPNCWCIFWYGPTHHETVLLSLRLAGFKVDDIPAIWSKGIGQTNAPDIYLARSYEPFFIARKGNPVLAEKGVNNVFNFPPVTPSRKFHPTQRPVELMDKILTTFAYPNSNIFIPFLGSGVTLRSCYRNNMRGFGCDLSKDHKLGFINSIVEDIRNET